MAAAQRAGTHRRAMRAGGARALNADRGDLDRRAFAYVSADRASPVRAGRQSALGVAVPHDVAARGGAAGRGPGPLILAALPILGKLSGIGQDCPSHYWATAMVTLSVVVTPPIRICRDTAFPMGVVGSGTTPIWYSLTNCGESTE